MAAPFVGDRSLQMHKEGDENVAKLDAMTTYEMVRAQDARAFRNLRNIDKADHQRGQVMSAFDFINRLQVACPRAVVIPIGPKKAHYGVVMLDKFQLIARGDFPNMIEWSRLQPWQEKLPERGKVFKDAKNGVPYEAFEPGMPFEKVVHTSWIEVERGWRTILIKYIKARLISDAEAIRLFGAPDRASWAALLAHVDGVGLGI